MAWLMLEEQITMPPGKKQKQERGRITEEILNRMSFEEGDNQTFRVNVSLYQKENSLLATLHPRGSARRRNFKNYSKSFFAFRLGGKNADRT
jgi:hypothetical protein